MSHPVGSTLLGYRIDAEIGRGETSVVYRATWIARQRAVALKVTSPRPPTVRADVERVVAAARALQAIDHPNVLPVYEAYAAGDEAVVAMRLVDGPSLEALLRAPGGLDPRRLETILEQAAAGLDHLAAQGIVHGGVRPANILVGPGDHAYLADAGLGPRGPGPEADRAALAAIAAAAAPPPGPAATAPPPPPPPPPPPMSPPPAAAPPAGPRWRVPAIVGATLAALLVVAGVIALATDGGGPRTVTTFVPDPPAAPAPTGPLGAVLPEHVDGWRLIAGDPSRADRTLHRLGRVETAHAISPTGSGVLVGVLPPGGDVATALAGVRAAVGGVTEGTVRVAGVAEPGRVQRDGPLVAVTFADGGRVLVAVATERATALALADATGRAVR